MQSAVESLLTAYCLLDVGMIRFLRALFDGLLLRCPRCHTGRMFARGFTMNPACPNCGLPFEKACRQKLHESSINRYRHYEQHLKPYVTRLEPLMKAYDYKP